MSLGSNNVPSYKDTTAAEVSYNNTASKLTAQDAQAALDELRSMIDAFKAEIISGEISTPLDTEKSVTIETAGGEEILAVQNTSAAHMKEYADAAVARAAAAIYGDIGTVRGSVSTLRSEYDASMAVLDDAILAD